MGWKRSYSVIVAASGVIVRLGCLLGKKTVKYNEYLCLVSKNNLMYTLSRGLTLIHTLISFPLVILMLLLSQGRKEG